MVQLSCHVQCTRAILFALNIVFLLIGLSVMGLGIYIKSSRNYNTISEIYNISEAFGGEAMRWIGVGMIIAGVLTACLAVFGCLGAVMNNRCFLYVYSVFLILIITFEFAAIILILVFRNNLWNTYDSGFLEVFHHAYRQNQTETIKIIENLERQFQCCGVDGYSDYRQNGYPIPNSCYPHESTIYHPYSLGCAKAVVTWIWNELPILAGVLGGILFIEIFGLISSLVLGVSISHSLKTDNYYMKI
jgi:hypothetical protein